MDLHGLTRSGASSGQRHPVGHGEAVQLLRLRGRRARPAREASAPPGVLQPHLHPHLLQHHHLPPPSSSSSATTTSTYSSARLHHILHHQHVRPHSLVLMLAQTPLGCMHVWVLQVRSRHALDRAAMEAAIAQLLGWQQSSLPVPSSDASPGESRPRLPRVSSGEPQRGPCALARVPSGTGAR